MEGIIASFTPLFNKYRIEIVLIILSLVIASISVVIYVSNNRQNADMTVPKLASRAASSKVKNIFIDLSGSIEKPDIYEVSGGARLKDILILAGGLSRDADREFFTRNFNLARILRDEEKIYIPSYDETGINNSAYSLYPGNNLQSNILGASDKVNINNATLEKLDTLPGVGQVTAQKIIQNRPYNSIEELVQKKAVGKSVFEKLKELIQI